MRKFFVLVLILAVVLMVREVSFSQKTKKQTKTTTQKTVGLFTLSTVSGYVNTTMHSTATINGVIYDESGVYSYSNFSTYDLKKSMTGLKPM